MIFKIFKNKNKYLYLFFLACAIIFGSQSFASYRFGTNVDKYSDQKEESFMQRYKRLKKTLTRKTYREKPSSMMREAEDKINHAGYGYSRSNTNPLQRSVRNKSDAFSFKKIIGLNNFFSDKTKFSIALPIGFEKTEDTLDLVNKKFSGVLKLKNNDTSSFISVFPKNETCDYKSEASIENYLKKKAAEYSNYSHLKPIENKSITLKEKKYGFVGKGKAWYSEYRDMKQGQIFGELIFFDPDGNLWMIEIEEINRMPIILTSKNTQTRFKIFKSIFQTSEKLTETNTLPKYSSKTIVSASNSVRRGNIAQSMNLKEIYADNISFKIDVPNDFQKTEDTLDWNTGSLILENEKMDSMLQITATDTACYSQTDREMRSCIRKSADSLFEDFKENFSSYRVLQNKKGYSLQLVDDGTKERNIFNKYFQPKKRNYWGQLLLIQVGDSRIARFVFAEPREPDNFLEYDPLGFIWYIDVEIPEDFPILDGGKNTKSMLSSMIFDLTEK